MEKQLGHQVFKIFKYFIFNYFLCDPQKSKINPSFIPIIVSFS